MTRSLRVAVQMDPIETINIDADSTFALMLEAQRARPCAVALPCRATSRFAAGASAPGAGRCRCAASTATTSRCGAQEALDLGSGSTWC